MKTFPFYAVDDLGNRLEFDQRWEGEHVFLTLKKEKFAAAQTLRVLGAFSAAQAGEAGWYVLPRNIKMNGDMQVFFREREDTVYAYKHPIMAWYGVKTPRLTAMVRFARNYHNLIEVNVRGGEYHVCLLYDFTVNDPVYDDIRLEVIFFEESAGYAEMARTERELRLARGEIRDLTEKCKSPAVEYARKYPLIRIRMGWKQSPSPVLFQTPETEPDMFVACTFARVREIADALKAAGVAGVELQLVGWNQSGHDGRFPQLFPVDARLGGEAELKKTIAYVKSLGYRISLHTNLIDTYTIADTFTYDDVCVKRDGSIAPPAHAHYSGGLTYHVCPVCQTKNNLRDLPAVAALGTNGVHFIDVISIEEPDCCASVRHPSSTARGWEEKHKALSFARDLMGAISSEGCFDGVLLDLDYGLYVSFGDGFGHTDVPFCDTVLPLYELTYHSVVLYNPTSPTINYPIKTPADQLTFLLRGGRPSLYIYSKFRTGGKKNWMGEIDLTTENEAALERTVAAVCKAQADYAPLADKQLVPMADYQVLANGIEIAVYADGTRVIGNFSEKEQTFEGSVLAPFGYVIK